MVRQRKTGGKSASAKRDRYDGPPQPYKRPAEVLQPIIDTLDEKHVYIMHIDHKPVTQKRGAFLVAFFINLGVVALFCFRVWYISPYYFKLLTAAMGHPNETSLNVAEMTWAEIAPEVGYRAATILFDILLFNFLWTWPIDFCFAQTHGNPVEWRRSVGFRDREVVVRRSRKWSTNMEDVVNDGEDGTSINRSFFLSRIQGATSPFLIGEKTGWLLRDEDWELDWGVMVDATTMVDKKMAALEAFKLVVLLHHDEWGWLSVDLKNGAPGGQEEGPRRQVLAFQHALREKGKEDLFFRWVEVVQFESSQPGGFGPEKQEKVAKDVREMFLKEGIDFDALWKESVGTEAAEGLF